MAENKDELLTACKVDTSQIDQYRRDACSPVFPHLSHVGRSSGPDRMLIMQSSHSRAFHAQGKIGRISRKHCHPGSTFHLQLRIAPPPNSLLTFYQDCIVLIHHAQSRLPSRRLLLRASRPHPICPCCPKILLLPLRRLHPRPPGQARPASPTKVSPPPPFLPPSLHLLVALDLS